MLTLGASCCFQFLGNFWRVFGNGTDESLHGFFIGSSKGTQSLLKGYLGPYFNENLALGGWVPLDSPDGW